MGAGRGRGRGRPTGAPGRRLVRLDHPRFGQGHQQQPGPRRRDRRAVENRLQEAGPVQRPDEVQLRGVVADLLQPQHRVGRQHDEAPRVPIQHGRLPGVVVVAADAFQDQPRRRPLEPRAGGGRGGAGLEQELAVHPREDLQQLRLQLVDQRAPQVVRGQHAHLDQDLPLLALLLLHAGDRRPQRVGRDQLLFQQQLPQTFGDDVRAHRNRVAVSHVGDLLRRLVQQQQRPGRARHVQALQHLRERGPLQRSRERRRAGLGGHRLGAALDLVPLFLLRRVVRRALGRARGRASTPRAAGSSPAAAPAAGR